VEAAARRTGLSIRPDRDRAEIEGRGYPHIEIDSAIDNTALTTEDHLMIVARAEQDIAADPEIDFVDSIAPAEFKRNYIDKNRPLLMRKATADWPAIRKWSFEYFASLKLPKRLYLEKGNVMQGTPEYDELDYNEYIRRLMDDDHGKASDQQGYLSVFKIFRAFPQLKEDVDFSLFSQFKLKNTVAGWIGPAGTVTGYHIDWGDNVFAQICGRKELRLVAPQDSRYMYANNRFDQGTTSSDVDVDHYDPQRFPLFERATEYRLVVHPGDMLFIPRGWWHHVRSLDKSISVSNLGYDAKGLIVDLVSHRVKQSLHDVGLYRVPCTCHFVRDGKLVRRSVAN
jgi:lysine-specific demethylase 8